MIAREKSQLRVVLHEGEGSESLDKGRRFSLLKSLLDGGYPVTVTGNATSDSAVSSADASDVLLLRESKTGESAPPTELHGESGPDAVRVHVRDLRDTEADHVKDLVDEVQKTTDTYHNPGWKPWFPVIDFDRCTNCMQCLSFCLFDVYGVNQEGMIEVRNEEKCKTNCPACSRVCPDVAILFPKYGAGPINGDVVQKQDVDREKMKIDISSLLGGDIYSMLRDRHQKAESRFSKERDEGKALKERMRCLKKLQEDLDIPSDVLMSLPSQDAIMEKAKQKAAETQSPNIPEAPENSGEKGSEGDI
ncbi:MAG: ferredoxin family protein [Planctomycetota bacterium]